MPDFQRLTKLIVKHGLGIAPPPCTDPPEAMLMFWPLMISPSTAPGVNPTCALTARMIPSKTDSLFRPPENCTPWVPVMLNRTSEGDKPAASSISAEFNERLPEILNT